MHDVRLKRKRSKTLVILMLPALIFIGFMGWIMYAMGSRKTTSKRAQKSLHKSNRPNSNDGVVFVPMNLEEEKVVSE